MNFALTRLVLFGGKGAWKRLAAITGGIAVGVTLFLTLWGASAGLEARDARTAWMRFAAQPATAADGAPVALTDETVLVSRSTEVFRGSTILRLGLAITQGSGVELPGGISAPAPGEYLASAGLIELIDTVPDDQLGDRFGVLAGELPEAILTGPDSLVIVEGQDEETLRAQGDALLVSDFAGRSLGENEAYGMIMLIGGIAVFLPIVLLVGIVTQLGAAQRSERFQTLRLIGATPRDLMRMAATEMAAAALGGALIGVVLAKAIRPLAAQVSANNTRFYASDLAVSPLVILLAALAVVLVSAFAAAHRVKKAGIGPLGASRQTQERRPRVFRALPLPIGLIMMATATLGSDELSNLTFQALVLIGFPLISVGIIVGGPWVVWIASKWFVKRANSAAEVIAISRIHRAPVATFRSVSGLVVAVFMVSLFAGAASIENQVTTPTDVPGLLPPDAAYTNLRDGADGAELQRRLARVDGVTATVFGYPPHEQAAEVTAATVIVTAAEARALGFEAVPDSDYVSFDGTTFVSPNADQAASLSPVDGAAAEAPAVLFVRTDGNTDSMERAQTAVVASGYATTSPLTRLNVADLETAGVVNNLATLAYLGVAIAVVIAGISLAVSTAAAVLDRKRAFGLMRLMGMPVAPLRRVVAIEALAPLLLTLIVTIGLGFLVAWLVITGLTNGLTMTWPDPRYFIALAVSATFAACSILATFGIIRKNTSIEATRFE